MPIVTARSWFLCCVPVALLALSILGQHARVEASAPGEPSRYVTFCCQPAEAAPAEANDALRFAPCYEAPDSKFGRQCRSESLYFYPVAIRTDRTFSFDNTTRELVVYRR